MENITMNDIQMAVAKTSREDFMRFAKKDYHSLHQKASRLVARLRGKRVWTYEEFIKELTEFSEVMYPQPK